MQVSIESTNGLERKMTVELPPERVEPEVEKRLKEVARNVRMDGFRPGKVPLKVVRQRYGQQVREEVFGELIRDTYYDALTSQDVHPAGEPRIDLMEKDTGEGMGYTATFEVMPEFTVGDISDAVIKRPKAEVSEEDVDKMVERLREQHVDWQTADREAADKDRVIISFKGTIDGEAFDGGSAEDTPLVLGSGNMIEGFESGLVGAKAGETRTLDVTFPEDYRATHLAGKAAQFEATVSKVEEPLLPEVDDEFCKQFGVEEGGVEALRQDVRSNMERELADRVEADVKDKVMNALIEKTEIDLPAALITQECKALRDRARQSLGQQGGRTGQFELPLNIFEDQAKKRVALGLIVAEIVKQHEIKVDADRVRKRVERLAESYENPQEVVDYYYQNREQLSAVEGLVLEDQVVDWVVENAKVEDEASDFYSLMNQAQ